MILRSSQSIRGRTTNTIQSQHHVSAKIVKLLLKPEKTLIAETVMLNPPN